MCKLLKSHNLKIEDEENIPTTKELLEIIKILLDRQSILEKKLETIIRDTQKNNRLMMRQTINKTPYSNISWNDFINNLNIKNDYLDILCNEGIIEAYNKCIYDNILLYKKTNDKLPIYSIENKIYYCEFTKELNTKEWIILSNDIIKNHCNIIHSLFSKQYIEWNNNINIKDIDEENIKNKSILCMKILSKGRNINNKQIGDIKKFLFKISEIKI